MLGYGDIVPITASEMWFALVAIIISCIIFGYSLN
ncbi:MAG: ion channel [bacterium]